MIDTAILFFLWSEILGEIDNYIIIAGILKICDSAPHGQVWCIFVFSEFRLKIRKHRYRRKFNDRLRFLKRFVNFCFPSVESMFLPGRVVRVLQHQRRSR